MAESSSRGVKLYHEPRDGSTPSAVHCVNALAQGPLFCEFDTAAAATELDRKRRLNLLWEFGLSTYSSGHFRFDGFGVQPTSPHRRLGKALIDFEQEGAFVCHRAYEEDWTCVRRVDGERYEFDSLYPAPEHVPGFYVPAYIDTLEGFGWTVFLVGGKLQGARGTPAARAQGNDGPRSSREAGAGGRNRDGDCSRRNVGKSHRARTSTRGTIGWACIVTLSFEYSFM
ncbi:putative ataxin-3 homolog [Rhodamnia argentea]|uniref:ubiquitinyl hydrolase 1 n=1 Tax=Rhodamnia argentea TaxID=178133 RepID=A0A8B8NG61_9MYRT|nr:putative ataxin-3 homolog [Rhodamnia argentea]